MGILAGARRKPFLSLVCTGALFTGIAFAGSAAKPTDLAQTPEGNVNYVKTATSSFDSYTRAPTDAQAAWMRSHYERMLAYSSYFDSRTSWFPNAWVYKDLYAIYPGSSQHTQHPEWILKDAAGNNLWIPFACSGGTCSQYAADFGNPGFRAQWIADMRTKLSHGYRGMYIDDVNMEWRVGNGNGQTVFPIDPRTGQTMTLANWRRYMAEMLEEIRAAFPNAEIVHNALWFTGVSDPSIQRQIDAADWFGLERGFNDGGIRGGGGQFGYQTFMSQIDFIHSRGRHVFVDAVAPASGLEYGLANYFLINDGADLLGNHDAGSYPDNWWAGNDVALGAARGPRYQWNGVWRRDFTGGTVLVNEPGATAKTLALGSAMTRIDGSSVTSVTLGAASGVVLRGAGTPPPTTVASTTTPPAPTTLAPTTTVKPTTTTRPVTTTTRPATTTTRPPTTTSTTTPPGPGLRVLLPTNGTTFGSTLRFRAEASHPAGVAYVEFAIDGRVLRRDENPEYEMRWRVPREFPRGPHTVTVTAVAGNGSWAQVSVLVTH